MIRFNILASIIFIPLIVIGQKGISVGLSVNYPVFDNKTNTLINNLTHSSLFEEVRYSEKPGLSFQANHIMPFVYGTFLSIGLGLDWLNYDLEYDATNIFPQNPYEKSSVNPLLEKYDAVNPSFTNTILFASIPISCKYPILGGMANVTVAMVVNIQLYNNQEFKYIKYVYSGGDMRIERHVSETKKGISSMLLLFDTGCEYKLNDDLAITFDYRVELTPLYNDEYRFVGNTALNLFSLGVTYCFLR